MIKAIALLVLAILAGCSEPETKSFESEMTMFYSEQCRPCHTMKGFIDDFSEKHNIDVQYIEVETNRELVKEHNISATPTIFVEDNKVSFEQVASFEELETLLLQMRSTK
ncbi:thioredoxin family protein [Vibrio hippocampi]|uniref:Thioredoxin domain-containing protein n=1 Tax=Vibrio hippocampi TaxID=654686 RepID=A0ABN8DEJ1_9VIBR|nr:thioredoxin family protein [Vibrio hippocampi]CAH0525507.1 hypothetical protein VHP8226_01032 [Vibrio hippocampi]